MKYQEKQKWKRTAAAVIALLITLAMVAGLFTPFIAYAAPVATQTVTMQNGGTTQATPSIWQEKEFGQEQFTLDAEVGFGGEYIVGKSAPLKGVITNNGAAFRGELQVKVYNYEEVRTQGRTAEYSVYYQELELLEGASQKIDMELNFGMIQRHVQVTLVDEKGNTVFLQNINLTPREPATLAVGVLSERPQDMQILAGMMPPESRGDVALEYYYRTYFLDGESFPSSGALLENFRIIVADGIDFAALTQEQRDALNGWVTGGGALVLGTGETGARTLGGLELTADIQLAGMAAGSLQGAPVTLAVLEGEGVEPLWQEGGMTLAYQRKEGAGRVLFPAFSLSTTPVTEMAEAPAALWEICRMADSNYLGLSTDNNDQYYYYGGASSFPPLGMGTVRLLLGLLAAYIVIVGPALYLVLKRMDKREKGWIVIPALAVLFMAGIFIVSKTSPYGKGMMRLISTVELTEGAEAAAAETELYLKSADVGSLTYSNEEKLNIFPEKEDYYYYNLLAGDVSCGYKMLSGDRTEITFFDNQSWATNHLSVKSTVQTGGAMQSTLRLEDGRLKGTVTNGTNTGFVDSVLSVNGIWVRIGAMEAGETLEIDQPATLDGTDSYTLFERVFYDDYSGNNLTLRERVHMGEISREEAFRIRSEYRLMQETIDGEYSQGGAASGEMRMEFYGFSETPVLEHTGLLNGKEPFISALTLYRQTFATELSKLEHFDIPFAIRPETVETTEQYEWNNHRGATYFYLYHDGEADFLYGIADGVALELFQFEAANNKDMVREETRIYNVSTGEWEILRTEEYTSPEDYISDDRKVRLRFFLRETNDINIPGMRVKGSGLLAGN